MLRSIRTKLLVFQIGVLIVVSVLFGFSYLLLVDELRTSQKRNLEDIATDQAARLSALIENKKAIFEKIAQGEAVQRYSENYRDLMLMEYFSQFTAEFPILAYVNPQGLEDFKLINGEPSEVLSDISKSTVFGKAIGEPNTVVVLFSSSGAASSPPYMKFAFCREFLGEIEGMVATAIPLSDIVAEVGKFKFRKTGFLLLLDGQGTILSHPQKDKILQKVAVKGVESEKVISQAIGMKSGSGHSTIQDIEGYVGYAPVKGRDWTIIATLPEQEFMAVPNALRDKCLIVIITILILGGFILLLIASKITGPLLKLTDVTKRISRGDIFQTIDIKSQDEIGLLAESFKKMTANLQEMISSRDKEITQRKQAEEDLIKYQNKLEHMVEERTRVLKEVQRELVNKAIEAGRAQLSAMVLHNIGNAITPIKIQIEKAKMNEFDRLTGYLEKCCLDLNEKRSSIQQYVNEDPKGKEVFSYLGKLVDALKEYGKIRTSRIDRIDSAVSYISETLTLQQAYTANIREKKEKADLNALIEDALHMQASSVEKRNIVINKDLYSKLPPILIDKSRMVQVMVNLIKNSYEAIDEKEEGERAITIKTFLKDGDPCVEIADSGIGIEPEKMETLFKFGNSNKGSSGVGLYYCKMFVEENRGTIHISSPGKGRGTTIRVIFKT